MNNFLKLIGSMKLMVVMMSIFAVAIGIATFIENDFGTQTAKAEVYNALWFEVLLALLSINLIINMINAKMFSKKKSFIFIFHTSFLIILLGAAITRYAGFEGSMLIQQGQTSNKMISTENYISVKVEEGKDSNEVTKSVILSKISKNSFSENVELNGANINVKLVEYIPNAVYKVVEDPNGRAILNMMISDSKGNDQLQLEEGKYIELDNLVLDFNSQQKFDKPSVAIFIEDNKLKMLYNQELKFLKMDSKEDGVLDGAIKHDFNNRTLYTSAESNFVLRDFKLKAIKKMVSNTSKMARGSDALKFVVSDGTMIKDVTVFGQAGAIAGPAHVDFGKYHLDISYGAKEMSLPFSIKLREFVMDRYPGSNSPSSYASEVTLIDEADGVNREFRIYMNNVLDYKGYRFFQSSYTRDEKGTILSVNSDPGTLVTYFGYLLLGIGMFTSLLFKRVRFEKLSKTAKKMAESASALSVLLLLSFTITPSHSEELNPVLKTVLSFDEAHAEKFGELVAQDSAGRMKPVDTLSREIINKIYRGSSILGLNSNQILLGMMVRPDAWREIKMIYVGDKALRKELGLSDGVKYAAFSEFFDSPTEMSGYKLSKLASEASRKPQSKLTKFDKAVLKTDEKVNISYMIYTGDLVRIWPKPNDSTQKWYATVQALQTFEAKTATEVRDLAMSYFQNIDLAIESGDWAKANESLTNISKFQKFYGAAVILSDQKVEVEILYNEINIFEMLWPLFFIVGFVLLILSFIKIVKPSFKLDAYSKASFILLGLFFIAQTFGLALRWYISGHAPWSDGYESMVYIAWATVLAGFIFSKNSPITLAATSILAGLILFVAHLNWMNPQVTNLVPVLQSYWLSIHVSMITASYGFLGLGALLGFITLILFIMLNDSNKDRISLSIKELNAINEMGLMIGLAMLTVGNFLGGVWANESWGRYWGWDPKETWALVTILVYAIVMHFRFIKELSGQFAYAVSSLLAFTSVIMTYFGVNYYLAGMHSYAKGDPVPIPDFVPITYIIIFIIIALAYRKRDLLKG
ncbi:MAG: cytochrome C biogenesis protein [Helicobacteraceae bacterium]|nr:cytochrome C biogenesis protein [Helicobacteraceae bacterium]